MLKKHYCCEQLQDAVLRGTIREHVIVEGKPEFNVFILEYVVDKSIKKHLFLFKEERTVTKELILKYCIFCWQQLHEC